MNETLSFVVNLKRKIEQLEADLKIYKACLALLEPEAKTSTQEPRPAGPRQTTLNGATAKPRKEKPLRIEAKDVFLPPEARKAVGEYERHTPVEEFNRKAVQDAYLAIIEELNNVGSDVGVPIIYLTKKLGINRNNGYYAAKHLARQNKELVYVKFNKWKQYPGYVFGLISRARAHQLDLKIKEVEIENKEESKHGTGNETADS